MHYFPLKFDLSFRHWSNLYSWFIKKSFFPPPNIIDMQKSKVRKTDRFKVLEKRLHSNQDKLREIASRVSELQLLIGAQQAESSKFRDVCVEVVRTLAPDADIPSNSAELVETARKLFRTYVKDFGEPSGSEVESSSSEEQEEDDDDEQETDSSDDLEDFIV